MARLVSSEPGEGAGALSKSRENGGPDPSPAGGPQPTRAFLPRHPITSIPSSSPTARFPFPASLKAEKGVQAERAGGQRPAGYSQGESGGRPRGRLGSAHASQIILPDAATVLQLFLKSHFQKAEEKTSFFCLSLFFL